MVKALFNQGFVLDENTPAGIVWGKNFAQLWNGPFDLNLVFAPNDIENFVKAEGMAICKNIFPIANLCDIIDGKKASRRMEGWLGLSVGVVSREVQDAEAIGTGKWLLWRCFLRAFIRYSGILRLTFPRVRSILAPVATYEQLHSQFRSISGRGILHV